MQLAATLTAAAIASTGLALAAKPANAQTAYQQVFASCLHHNQGRMDICHPFTNCFVDTASKNPWMTVDALNFVCRNELTFGLNPYR